MAYDYHGLWENVTGLGSPLDAPEGDLLNVRSTMNYYLQHGASKEKLIVGLGVYARTWSLIPESTYTGVGAPAVAGGIAGMYTREPGVLAHYEVCNLLKNGYTAQLDPQGKVMYAYKGNQWVTYEDRETIGFKLNYILENDFGGAMIWSLDHDDFTGSFCQEGVNPLITVISGTLINAPE
ncbi:unnamed protein product [Candidula unifasciata]|uniref:GH18 domain-containing protein n=1 Tax=Candidula unifasciata TaxID=100452 RepID=A0A8S3Z159_9EUPU|nr:unnamed protein product [Candidula unifasciata]